MKRFTTSSSAFYDKGIDKGEFSDQIHFMLCHGCLWCASFIGMHERMITQSPSCNSIRLESMPISEREAYRFDYHPKRGITLEFLKIAGYSGLGCPL
jgi:hypothetical protein